MGHVWEVDYVDISITASSANYLDPVIVAAMKGAKSVSNFATTPSISDFCIPIEVDHVYQNGCGSCDTSLSSGTGKNCRSKFSPGISISSHQTDGTIAKKSLVPSVTSKQIELQDDDFSSDFLFSPGQIDPRVFSKSTSKYEKDFSIDPALISPHSMKWSPSRAIRNKHNMESLDISVSSNERMDCSVSSTADEVDFKNASQNSRMLLDCSSFTQHDFTPLKRGTLDLDKEQLNGLLSFGTVNWQQITARWKHSELARMMIGKL